MEDVAPKRKTQGIFLQGWIMVFVCFVVIIVTQGFGQYSYGIIKVNITEDLGVSAAAVAAGYSTYTMSIALCSLIVGDVIERFSLRVSLIISAILFSGGFFILSIVSELWQVYAAYIIMGVGNAFGSVVPITGVVSNWFEKRRGIATALVWCGMFPGSLISNFLIANMSDISGWQSATLLLGVISLVILLGSSFLLKWRPQEIGLLPDGASVAPDGAAGQSPGMSNGVFGLTRKQALLTVSFWLIFFSYGINGLSEMGLFQNMAAFLSESGHDLVAIAAFMSAISVAGVVGRICTGLIIDKIGPKKSYLIINSVVIVGILLLFFMSQNAIVLYIGGFCVGVGLSCGVLCLSTAVASSFGTKSYGQIWGAVFMMKCVGDSIGVPMMAGIAESSLGWSAVFVLAAGLVAASTILVQFVKKHVLDSPRRIEEEKEAVVANPV